jgi:hypothetical protein
MEISDHNSPAAPGDSGHFCDCLFEVGEIAGGKTTDRQVGGSRGCRKGVRATEHQAAAQVGWRVLEHLSAKIDSKDV